MAGSGSIAAKNLEIAREPRAADYAVVVSAAVIWGGSFASTKLALAQSDPVTLLMLRYFIAIPLLALSAYLQKTLRLPRRSELLPIFAMGFQGLFFHHLIQAYAMRTSSAANANWVMVAGPALVAIFGRIFLGEKISRTGVTGLALSAAGVGLVLSLGTVRNAAFVGFGSIGDLMLIASVVNWAAFSIISRRFLQHDMEPGFMVLWEMLVSMLCALLLMLMTGRDFSGISGYSAATWRSIIFLGVFASALAHLFWFQGLSVLPAARVVIFQFLQPLVGIVVSYFLVGERFTPWLFIGGAMIAIGVWLVNRKPAL